MLLKSAHLLVIGSIFLLTSELSAEPLQSRNWPAARTLDADRLSLAGLRIVRSTHCTMVTDLPTSPSVDELPAVVDAAMIAWAKRFGLIVEGLKSWRVRVYLIGEQSRFHANRLMPMNSEFPHGYALGYEVWLYDQPTDYYRRHLLLHEVTHALMMTKLGGCGPPWYMEGIAELCGTHAWKQATQELRLATFPSTKQEAPHWGRVRLIQDALKQQTIPSIESLLKVDNRVAMSVDTYAWVWALAKYLDSHPRYQKRWRSLTEHVLDPEFDNRFLTSYAMDRNELDLEWRLFLSRICYGYDIEREAIVFLSGKPLRDERSKSICLVEANRGWQSSGVFVEAGKKYSIRAEGRFVIGYDANGDPWPCEPGGVTLDYEAGRPLGELLATVDSDTNDFLKPFPIGLGRTLQPKRSGTLYLRLNDAPNRLRENRGAISVTISID